MADTAYHFSFPAFLKMLIFTTFTVGLCYWTWQDINPLLRPLRGDFWAFVKDLNILVNGAAMFVIITAASLLFDHNGTQNFVTRVCAAFILVAFIGTLVLYGRFFEKEISPFFSAFT